MAHDRIHIGFYPYITATIPTHILPLTSVLTAIKSNQWETPIRAIRARCPGDTSPEAHAARNPPKQQLPYVTFGGLLTPSRS